MSRTQEDSQIEQDLASEAAGLVIDDAAPIDTRRVAVFRTALGQLLNSDLFEDDSAALDAVISAVNRKVSSGDGGAFERAEAVKALKKLEEANHIMFVVPMSRICVLSPNTSFRRQPWLPCLTEFRTLYDIHLIQTNEFFCLGLRMVNWFTRFKFQGMVGTWEIDG